MKFLVVNCGNSLNNGNLGMATVFAKYAREHFGEDCVVDILMNQPTRRLDAERFGRYGLKAVSEARLDLAFWKGKLIIPVWMLVLVGCLLPKKIKPSPFRFFKKYDAVISLCGEDYLSDNVPWGLALRMAMVCFLTKSTGGFFAVFAQTCGPFQRRWSRWLAKRCYEKSDLITVRDARSEEIVKDLVPNAKVPLCADIAFLLEPDDFNQVRLKHPEVEQLSESDKPLIGISVSSWFAHRVFSKVPDLDSREMLFHQAMADALDAIIKETGAQICFVGHVTLYRNDDRDAAHTVLRFMRNQENAVVLEDVYTAAEIKAVIGRCGAFVGCRMHALLAAISSHVPTVALAYSPKTIDVIQKGLKYDWVLDVRKQDDKCFHEDLIIEIRRVLSDSEKIKKHLICKVKEARVWARYNFKLLKEKFEDFVL